MTRHDILSILLAPACWALFAYDHSVGLFFPRRRKLEKAEPRAMTPEEADAAILEVFEKVKGMEPPLQAGGGLRVINLPNDQYAESEKVWLAEVDQKEEARAAVIKFFNSVDPSEAPLRTGGGPREWPEEDEQ